MHTEKRHYLVYQKSVQCNKFSALSQKMTGSPLLTNSPRRLYIVPWNGFYSFDFWKAYLCLADCFAESDYAFHYAFPVIRNFTHPLVPLISGICVSPASSSYKFIFALRRPFAVREIYTNSVIIINEPMLYRVLWPSGQGPWLGYISLTEKWST